MAADPVAFEDNDAPASPGKTQCRREPVQAAADHGDVEAWCGRRHHAASSG
jgi:hypothetical protein